MPAERLFGTDGVRGTANSPHMNTEMAVALGRAAGYLVRSSKELPHIVIGKDTRLSGYMLENALASGVTSMGVDVVRTGPLPTPGVSFICSSMRAHMGIMVSASHNPAEQNGIKFFGADGFKLGEKEEREIERLIAERIPEKNLAEPNSIGRIRQIDDAHGRYVQHLKECFPHRLNLLDMKIAVDCANGAAYRAAPYVFTELGAHVIATGDRPDGLNVNKRCGALYPENIQRLVKEAHADIGITLDGDADRVILCDERGNILDGDAILYISAKHLHTKGHLGSSTVVGTHMTNSALEEALKNEGISLVRTDVGDHNVIAYMHAHGINLGGEPSGHIIYMHHGPTGDGILAALRVLSIMKQNNKTLSELAKGYRPYPQKTINVRVREKRPLEEMPSVMEAKRSIEARLEGTGRTLLRYSGTEMLARITVESSDEATTAEAAGALAEAVRREIGSE